jgi:hypothetical protein
MNFGVKVLSEYFEWKINGVNMEKVDAAVTLSTGNRKLHDTNLGQVTGCSDFRPSWLSSECDDISMQTAVALFHMFAYSWLAAHFVRQ